MDETRNPREHYAEAERLLEASRGEYIGESEQLAMIQRAQVHATLATVDPKALWSQKTRPPEVPSPLLMPVPVPAWAPPDNATGANPPPPDNDPLGHLPHPDVEVSSDGGKTWAPFPLASRAPLRSAVSDGRCHDDSHGNLYRAVGSDADPSSPVYHRPATPEQLAAWRRTRGD